MLARVHFINRFFHPDVSATSQMLSGVAFGLAGVGLEIHVVTSRQLYENPSADLPSEETLDGVFVHRLSTTRFGRSGLWGRALDYLSFYWGTVRYVWRNVRAGDIVVAKTDPPLLSIVVGPIARRRRAMTVNWLQDVFPEVARTAGVGGKLGALAFEPVCWLRNRSLRKSHINVAIGDRMAQHLVEQGIPLETITIIPNWADAEHVRPIAPEDNRLRTEWGLSDRIVVGYSGNLGRVHDIETTVAAIEGIAGTAAHDEMAARISFLFVGGGVKRRLLEAAIAEKQLTNVHFKPYQPYELLSESLGVADIHLVSLQPEHEGLIVPSKFYGVAAAGRPTIFIGDRDGEIPRLLRKHNCGRSVAAGDGDGLGRAVQKLAGNTALRTLMGERARSIVETIHNKEASVRHWARLIEKCSSTDAPA